MFLTFTNSATELSRSHDDGNGGKGFRALRAMQLSCFCFENSWSSESMIGLKERKNKRTFVAVLTTDRCDIPKCLCEMNRREFSSHLPDRKLILWH